MLASSSDDSILKADSSASASSDLIPDTIDNCPNTPNLPQQNSDTDLLGDACDPDDDNDFSLDDADCAPTNAAINPSATEICDGIDNNCDLQVDEGFLDTDSDGTANCVDADDDNDLIPDVLIIVRR